MILTGEDYINSYWVSIHKYKSIYEGFIKNMQTIALAIVPALEIPLSYMELQQIQKSCETNRQFIQKYVERISRMLKKLDKRIDHHKLRE